LSKDALPSERGEWSPGPQSRPLVANEPADLYFVYAPFEAGEKNSLFAPTFGWRWLESRPSRHFLLRSRAVSR